MKSLLIILSILWLATTSASAASGTYRVIVHRTNAVDNLEAIKAQRIFLGKTKKWPNGQTIDLVLNTNDATQAHFSQQLLGKTPRQLQIFWRKALYSGNSTLPLMMDNDVAIIDYVENHPDAISIVCDDNPTVTVKTITITP